MEQFKDMLDRTRRYSITIACFFVAVMIVHKGNNSEGANFAFIVPLMCVITSLCLCVLGLAVFVKGETNPD